MRSLVPGRDFRSSLKKKKKKKFAGVLVTTTDDFFFFFWGGGLFGEKKNVCAIPVRVMKDQY